PILAPLEPHKSELLLLAGVDMQSSNFGPGDGHQKGMGHMLTGTELLDGTQFMGGSGGTVGWAGGISVDQAIANVIGNQTRFKSLEFGVYVREATVWSRMSYLGPNQPVPPESNPYAMFDRLFGDASGDPAALARLRFQRRSVLDATIPQYQALMRRL